jgi:hypothetical protein
MERMDRGEPDDGLRYYEHHLAAAERPATAKSLSDPAAMLARKETGRTPIGTRLTVRPSN